VVERAVVRLVTPGTLTEERLLEPGRANLLAAVSRVRAGGGWRYGVAGLDVSTGRFGVVEAEASGLAAELARLDPAETLVPDTLHDDPDLRALWRGLPGAVTPLPRDGLDAKAAERRLLDWFGVATLDAFGRFTPAELAAAGTALGYLERTQYGARPALSPPSRAEPGGAVAIDPATRANLELTRTLTGEREGSLVAAVDRTVTAAGARLLAERLSGPLTDLKAIRLRQDCVAALLELRDLRESLRVALDGVPDVARALARLTLGRGGPRDLACLREGLAGAVAVCDLLRRAGELPGELADAARALNALDPGLTARLAAALADSLPLRRQDGGFIRPGFDPEIDEARELGQDSRRVVAALQARYAAETAAGRCASSTTASSAIS
jgi:DNA mismatch repair protein MutS